MSDDLKKQDTESGGTESSPEYDQNTYQHLDRDQWYGDDETVEAELPAGDQQSADLAAFVSEPENPEASSIDDASEPIAEIPPVDPYDFGEVPDVGTDLTEETVNAETEPEPVVPEPENTAIPVAAAVTSDGAALPAGLTTIGAGWNKKIGGFFGRFVDPVEEALKPTGALVATTTQRVIVGLAVVIALISLLGDNSGFALMVLGFVLPLIIVLSVVREDVFESEPPLILVGVGLVGLVAGLVLGGFGSWIVRERWFDNGNLNYGAFGFGGRFADRAGNAGFLVWLLNGLVLPLASLAAVIGVPIALRRYTQFRNEIMDGTILGAISAAGFAIGTGIIFLSPGVSDGLPDASVSDWTLTTFAIIAVRPTILVLGGALLGIAIWRYMRDADMFGMILPAAGSVGAWLLLSLGSIQLQPTGVSVEFLWNILIAIGVYIIYKRVVSVAISIDRAALGATGGRIVCPHCRKLTPVGTFCANCGESLE